MMFPIPVHDRGERQRRAHRPGPPASLSIRVVDVSPVAAPLVSVQARNGLLLVNSTDVADGGAGASPWVHVNREGRACGNLSPARTAGPGAAKPSLEMKWWTCVRRGAFALAAAAAVTAPGGGAEVPDGSLCAVDASRRYELREQVVWVGFWASWCGSCAEAGPLLKDLEREFGSRGFAVLGISLDEDPRDALEFLAKYPADFGQAADSAGDCPRRFAVEPIPAS